MNEYFRFYDYDEAGRLRGEMIADEKSDSSTSYTYDLFGNRVKTISDDAVKDIRTIENYSYDANNRLTNVTTTQADKAYSNNGSVVGAKNYYYDNNGNMTAEQTESYLSQSGNAKAELAGHGTDESLKLYRYDAFNRLTSYTTSASNTSYSYYASNLRAGKNVNGTVTNFVWNGQNLASESTNGKTNTYTYDMTGIHLANMNGAVHSYLKDTHGSVTGKVNAAGSVMDEAFSYDAFGNLCGDTPDPFGYCGEYYDGETGLVYLRNRYYDTSIGRFITEDPIKDGLNWYAYCGGNPVALIDPSGLRGTMLKYAIEKNGGTVTYDENTGIATAKIGDIEKQYSGQIMNGRMIVDSKELANDFGMSEDCFIHKPLDFFDSEDDAALALALVYNPIAINVTGGEIAAYIYSLDNHKGGVYYEFDGVVIGNNIDKNHRGVVLNKPDTKLGRAVESWYHAHGPYTYDSNGNPVLDWNLFTDYIVTTDPVTKSNIEMGDALYSDYIGLNAYLSNPAGELKYLDMNYYTPQKGNYHVPESGPQVKIIASGIPDNL